MVVYIEASSQQRHDCTDFRTRPLDLFPGGGFHVSEIWGTVGGRWFVTLFALAYLVLGLRILGGKKLALYTVVAFVLEATRGRLCRTGWNRCGYRYSALSWGV